MTADGMYVPARQDYIEQTKTIQMDSTKCRTIPCSRCEAHLPNGNSIPSFKQAGPWPQEASAGSAAECRPGRRPEDGGGA